MKGIFRISHHLERCNAPLSSDEPDGRSRCLNSDRRTGHHAEPSLSPPTPDRAGRERKIRLAWVIAVTLTGAILAGGLWVGKNLSRLFSAVSHYNRGSELQDHGKLAEAIAEYREAIRLQPNHEKAHNNLGLALQDQGKLAEAIAEFREAIRLQPDFAVAHCNLGLALVKRGSLPEAIAACREAIRLKPDLAEAHDNLANA